MFQNRKGVHIKSSANVTYLTNYFLPIKTASGVPTKSTGTNKRVDLDIFSFMWVKITCNSKLKFRLFKQVKITRTLDFYNNKQLTYMFVQSEHQST